MRHDAAVIPTAAVSLWEPSVVIVLILAVGFVAAGVIDAIRIDRAEWEASGQSKLIWILFMAIGFVACGLIGVFATLIYFVSIRPRVKRAVP